MSTSTQVTSDTSSSSFAGAMFDVFLVALTVAVLAGTGWHLDRQLKLYHIPTQLELAMEDGNVLAKQLRDLEGAAFLADEQLRLRQRQLMLQSNLQDISRKVQEKKTANAQLQEVILARQHSIRQADKDARSLARNQLLPGMVVGLIRTSNGKVYQDSIIRGIDQGLITIRHRDGQARFSTKLLVKETLPPLARYAFGLDELVDMSDFVGAANSPSNAAPSSRAKESSRSATKKSTISTAPLDSHYELPKGQPVIDAATPSAQDASSAPSSIEEQWQEPLAPLPL